MGDVRVRLGVVGDVHASDHGPGHRTETYRQNIQDKLDEIVAIFKEKACTHVLFHGDLYHLKRPQNITHYLSQSMSDVMKRIDVPVYVNVGNHDISSGTLESLEKQPINALRFLPNVTLMAGGSFAIDDEIVLHSVPGVPIESIEQAYKVEPTGATHNIVVAHQDIVPDASVLPEVIREHVQDAGEVAKAANQNTKVGMVLYGHMHKSDGIYKKEGVVFANLGSICRLTVDPSDVNKEPEVLVLTFQDDEKITVSAERIKLKSVRPAAEVYRLEEHYEAKSHQADIDATIGKLNATKLHKFSIDDVIKAIEKDGEVEKPVKSVAVDLLEVVA